MGKYRRLDTDLGRENRRARDMQRQLQQQRAAKRLRGSSFADLPVGAIPADKVADPTAPGYVSLNAAGFPVAAAGGNVISTVVTVPPIFGSCVVSLTGRVFAFNPGLVDDYVYARVAVEGATSTAVPVLAPPAGSGLNVAPFTTIVAGLVPGGSFTLELWAASSAADWTPDPSNTADLSGVLLWF